MVVPHAGGGPQGSDGVAQIGGEKHGRHPGHLPGPAHIRTQDAGVGEGASQEGGMQKAGGGVIVRETAPTGEQSGVFHPPHRASDVSGAQAVRHRGALPGGETPCSRIRRAPSRTPATMFW